MMQKFEMLQNFLIEAKTDAKKFYEAGNKASGTRLRKYMQDIKQLAQEVRKEVTAMKAESKK